MFSVEKIARIVNGDLLLREDAAPKRAIHDSRLVEPGDLFVALPGLRTHGHAYLSDAFRRGACAALVSQIDGLPSDVRNIIHVADTTLALQQWASAWRQCLQTASLVAITGTNGKTTVKALLGHLLSAQAHAYVSPHNYNTEIGLPIALLAMPADTDIGVFELGAGMPGDIATLARILRPNVAILTSVGPGHLDRFKTIEAVATEKWSLTESLSPDGIAILNADSPHLLEFASTAKIPVLTTGVHHGEIRGHIQQSVPSLSLSLKGRKETLNCALVGEHNATNLLLASVAAHKLGMSWQAIARQMPTFQPVAHRLHEIRAPFGTLLDDSYNANPASMKAALDVLASWDIDSAARIFVFGDMLGLGEESAHFHREIARHALRLPIDVIVPVGQAATSACQSVADEAERHRLVILPRQDISHWVSHFSQKQVVLVKGSRGLALETLIQELENCG